MVEKKTPEFQALKFVEDLIYDYTMYKNEFTQLLY